MKKILLIPFVIFLNLWNSYAQIVPLLEYDWRLEKVIIDNEEILATQSVGSTEFEDWAHIYFYEEGLSFVWLHTSLTYVDENSSFVIHSFGGDFGSYHGAPSTDAFISDFLGENGIDTDLNQVFTYSFRYEEDLIYLDIVNEAGDVATFYTTTLSNITFERIELSIYPNPTSNLLHLEASQRDISRVEIFDVQSKQVMKVNSANLNVVDVSQLTNGMYFLKVSTSEGELTRKFVKK